MAVRKESNGLLEIYTLGRFRIKIDGQLASGNSDRANKAWLFFKYLLTNREKAVSADIIIDNFWPDLDPISAKQALYTCIHRLRSMLEPNRSRYESPRYIITQGGFYQLNPEANYWLDADIFETLCERASECMKTDSSQAAELFVEALSLYKGDYLSEHMYEDWVQAAQCHYQGIFRKAVLEYTLLLFENELYEEARRICEEALAHDPYEEQFHLRLLQSLVMGGNKREAKAYYEQACSILYEEYGISPSQEMLRLYQQIEQPGFKGNGPVDLANIQFEVETRDTMEGAYFCDPSVFMCVYSLERRRGKRSGVPLVLGSLNIDSFNGLNEKQTRESLSVLKEVLANTLRRGDVVCEWNESQFVILLTNVRGSDAEKVFRRIASRYMNRKAKGKLLDLKMWYRLIKD